MKYNQKTGAITSDIGHVFGTGYAGNGEGKNNPDMENVKNVGPIPKGFYKIGEPYDSSSTGSYTLHLQPFPENKMYGRGGFKIHGDDRSHPGSASHGCIVVDRIVRVAIVNCTDKILEVI